VTGAEFKEKVERYRRIEGSFNICSQIQAIFVRRLVVFWREPRQWMMIIGPFLNVMMVVLVIWAVVRAIFLTTQQVFDSDNGGTEEGEGELEEEDV
jgi:hypothetical protein